MKNFSILWALATLFHYQAFNKWNDGVYVWIISTIILIYPSNKYSLLVLSISQIIEILNNLPIKNNHWLITFFVNIIIVISYFDVILKKQDIRFVKKIIAPIIKSQLFILYFFSVLHKLNYNFLDSSTSCGTMFYRAMTYRFSFLPNNNFIMEILTIYTTLIVEALIPILLIFNRTKLIRVYLALLFHGLIGYNPLSHFWDFSSVMFPLVYILSPVQLPYVTRYIFIILLLPFNEIVIGLISWTIYCLCFIYAYYKNDVKFNNSKITYNNYTIVFIVIIMIINGLCPYIGLKTESSFNMFSNLQIDKNITNHIFIPLNWQIFDYKIIDPRFSIFKPIGNGFCTR